MFLEVPPPRLTGRATKDPVLVEIGPVTDADIALLGTERGTKGQAIKRLRDSHHALARALATGMRPAEAAAVTGYCLSRISILQADPTFKELLDFYRVEGQRPFGDFTERLAMTAKMVQEELAERLEDRPESFENEELRKLLETVADRGGYAKPTGKGTIVNVNLAARLEAGKARLNRDTLDIDVTPSAISVVAEEPVHE